MKPLILISLFILKTIEGRHRSRCFFPKAWHGEYFHLGYNSPLLVANTSIEGKGRCVENFGSHFVMEDEEYGEKCWRCMTMYRKHQNVLSYKESYCETYFDTFETLCSDISGDAPMHTMFRRDAEPVKCPFKGPFLFSYTKGGSGLNRCGSPKSYLDSCSDNHRLQLNFQACIDVAGSESATEELQCLASWSEGSKNYLVAEMNREHVYSDESKYRCFVYEKSGKGDNRTVRMAQSLTASCTGLWSPQEGYRTFDLEKVDGPRTRCELPSWMTSHHTWTSLDTNIHLHINSGERSFKLRNLQDVLHPEDSHVTCHDIVEYGKKGQLKVVTYVKSGCDSGFMCAVFSRETDNVMRVQFGQKARIPGEACSDLYFSRTVIKSMLLVSVSKSSSASVSCPLSGRYSISTQPQTLGPIPWAQCPLSSAPASLHLTSGCGSASMTLEARCGSAVNLTRTEYGCHAAWTGPDRRTNVIISRNSRLGDFMCLSYTEHAGVLSSEDCHPDSDQLPGSAFNLSLSGPCVQALSAVSGGTSVMSAPVSHLISLTLVILMSSLHQYYYH